MGGKYVVLLLALGLALAAAKPDHQQRIVGGTITTINNWPFTSGLLYSWNLQTFTQECGGTIITTTAIVSAAHCFYGDNQNNWRARVGSSYANSGGVVHNLRQIIIHPSYNSRTFDNDVAVLRTSINIVYNVNVQPGSIAGSNYYLADNQVVWAVGWGATSFSGPLSEQLRQVQIWTVNQATCRSRYAELGVNITDNMLCSGWLDVGGRDQCQGDSGGPLSHNNVIVGIASFGYQCGSPRFPGVNARVSRYTYWIQSAASFTFCITKNRWRSITSIDKWPYLTALLYSRDLVRYSLGCGGSIITTTAVLSAAHCFVGDTADNWRARVGSTNSNNGGIVHNFNRIVIHESYAKSYPFDNDVAILRTTSSIAYNANVQPARIASAIFDLADNSVVWAIGWGATIVQGPPSEQLRDVQIWTVNQAICKSRYAELGVTITDNMLCSGWLDVGGRDQCQGDSGGPLVHNSIVVGLSSFGYSCALPRYPGVNTRVSRLTSWIQKTATS